MATLRSLQGTGAARVLMGTGSSVVLTPRQQREVLGRVANDIYPHLTYGQALQRLARDPQAATVVREATARYCAAAPAAPAAAAPTTTTAPLARKRVVRSV